MKSVFRGKPGVFFKKCRDRSNFQGFCHFFDTLLQLFNDFFHFLKVKLVYVKNNVFCFYPQCGDSHLGEIWVQCPHNASGYFTIYGEDTAAAQGGGQQVCLVLFLGKCQ